MTVRLEIQGRLARITFDRPPLNVLSLDDLAELAEVCEAAADASVILFQGAGDRAFSAGNDVGDHAPDRAPAMLEAFHRAVRVLLEADAVTVADVRRDAFGGGCELVCACDLAYAGSEARFGQPEIDVGCFPPVAVSLLPRRIGWTRAAELVLTGRRIDAATAAAWGLVTGVDERGAAGAVEALLRKSPSVLRETKAALRTARTLGPLEGIEESERRYRERLLPLDDCAEGVRAFLEKRPPEWGGGAES